MSEPNEIPAEMLNAATEAMLHHPFDGNYQLLAKLALEAAGIPALIARAKEPDTNIEFDPLFLDPDEKVDYGYNIAWREVRRLLGMADETAAATQPHGGEGE